ncbi:MAG: TRIC cation channel family protein [Desulfovibrio sp.]|nr:TRIC cation channel family protein [Desulfovibrio sp.]
MESLSPEAALDLLDGLACALLAAAACCRARSFGAHVTGALVLGCLCGLTGPLLREAFLHGQAIRIASGMPAVALVGALGAIAGFYLLKGFRLFFWLDSASIGLAASVGAICSLPETGITGALALGLINALTPGLVRDMALGDTAMLVDRAWYATAAAFGAIVALAVFILIITCGTAAWLDRRAADIAILSGFCAVLWLRAWKGRNALD